MTLRLPVDDRIEDFEFTHVFAEEMMRTMLEAPRAD